MEREANYTVVGAFVLLVVGMATAFVYWYSDARNTKSYVRHEIYFEGSVSGLTVGSTVRYLGVDIGRVVDIRLDRRAATRVQVIADIDQRAPISEKTVAELSLLGVTGQMLSILTFSASRNVQLGTEFKVFESRLFTGGEAREFEPRDLLIADFTGDGRDDVALLIHDRVIICG